MIRFEEAYKIVSESAKQLTSEKVKLEDSLYRILAVDVISDMNMPPFDKSAVDGFACKMSDLKNPLEVIETIAAGNLPQKIIGNNQCSKIMTGAKIPEGADVVIMVEHTQTISENTIVFTKEKTTPNISKKAEDIKKGQVVLKKGTYLKPQHTAMLASVGCSEPVVFTKPKVAILSTGSELVEPNQIPGPAQIRNSNAWQLYTQVIRANATPVYYGIIEDSEEETDKAIKKALKENDVILLTGGVSMGDFDFVPKILKENNISLKFEKIQIKPGMPTVFGTHEKSFIFGLPGNPVSSYIIFEVLVKPFLQKMMGNHEEQTILKLPIGIDYKRKKTDRLGWIPSKTSPSGEIIPVEYHGSAHVFSICDADVIFSVEIGVSEISKGEMVDARQI
jgi:molybdopterin molybdotransferase